jgi:hypothetical protein
MEAAAIFNNKTHCLAQASESRDVTENGGGLAPQVGKDQHHDCA